jgi:hypothetical protein
MKFSSSGDVKFLLIWDSIIGFWSRRRERIMSFGIGICGRNQSMMLMAIANRRITGLRLGEVSFPFFEIVGRTKN